MDNTTPTLAMDRAPRLPHIVIVGGGAGGLQLATRLGDTIGRRGQAEIVLVDRYPTHFWKPLLHEAASGHRDPASHTIEYAAQAKRHGFRFVQGALQWVDRAARTATIAAVHDADGTEILPQRSLDYDDLVLAVGSVTNFFNVPGAERHALPSKTSTRPRISAASSFPPARRRITSPSSSPRGARRRSAST